MYIMFRLKLIRSLVKEYLKELYDGGKTVILGDRAIWKKVAFLIFLTMIGICFSPIIAFISLMILFAPNPCVWMDLE